MDTLSLQQQYSSLYVPSDVSLVFRHAVFACGDTVPYTNIIRYHVTEPTQVGGNSNAERLLSNVVRLPSNVVRLLSNVVVLIRNVVVLISNAVMLLSNTVRLLRKVRHVMKTVVCNFISKIN